MLCNIERETLLKAVGYAYSVVERRSAIPVLSYFLFEANGDSLTIKATDLDNAIIVKVEADVKDSGAILVNAQTFYDILRKSSDDIITCEGLENSVVISSKSARFSLNTLSTEEYPELLYLNESRKFSLNSDILKKLLNYTYFAMSSDEARYNLNGVLLNSDGTKIAAVATDVHRLSIVEANTETTFENFNFILSRKTVNECRKMLDDYPNKDIDILFNNVYISFNFGNIVFISKLVDGSFPEYQHIIPKELSCNNFKINRKQLMDALSRISIIVDDKTPIIKMNVKQGELNLNAVNVNKGDAEEKISVNYAGNPEVLGFNPKYIMDILTNVSSEEFMFFFKDSLSAIVIKEVEDQSSTFMVMPMLVN